MFQRVDLVRESAIGVGFQTIITWTPTAQQAFGDLIDELGDRTDWSTYRRSRTRHDIGVFARVVPDEPDELVLAVSAHVKDKHAKSRRAKQIVSRDDRLIEAMRSVQGPYELACFVEFVFQDLDESELWFPIPTQVESSLVEHGTIEIRGVSGIGTPSETTGAKDLLFDMSRWSDGVRLMLTFSTEIPAIDAIVLNEVLKTGKSLLPMFVARKRGR